MIAVSVIYYCHCHLSGCSTAVLTRGDTWAFSWGTEQASKVFSPSTCLRMSQVQVARVRQCSGDGGGHTDDRSGTAGSHEEQDYLHHPPLWRQIAGCRVSPHSSHCPIIPTIPIIPVLISHGSYQSIIDHMTSPGVTSVKWLHIPHSAQPSSADPLLLVCVPCTRIRLLTPCWLCTGVCCMCTALLTKW